MKKKVAYDTELWIKGKDGQKIPVQIQEKNFRSVESLAVDKAMEIREEIGKALKQNGISPRLGDFRTMLEAYRRKMFFKRDQPLETAWIGLGYGRFYNPRLFQTHDGKPSTPRVLDWWVLTPLGAKVMKAVIKAVPMPKRGSKEEYALNSVLYSF
jgi:hypothetical protein